MISDLIKNISFKFRIEIPTQNPNRAEARILPKMHWDDLRPRLRNSKVMKQLVTAPEDFSRSEKPEVVNYS